MWWYLESFPRPSSLCASGPAFPVLLFFSLLPSGLMDIKAEKNWGGGPYFTAWLCAQKEPSSIPLAPLECPTCIQSGTSAAVQTHMIFKFSLVRTSGSFSCSRQ